MMITLFLATLYLNCCSGQFFFTMNPDSQLFSQNMVLKYDSSEFQTISEVLAFGLLSRYSPLSDIAQVGKIGVFDSNCYHQLNAVDKQQKINFIYYDCLDQENQIITKHVRFIDDTDQEHNYQVIIPNDQYENVWYYFQIEQWPLTKKFHLLIMRDNEVILQEELQITYPFNDSELILTFGGGIDAYFGQILQLSYFPGTMTVYPFGYYDYSPDYAGIINFSFILCECFQNENTLIIDSAHNQKDKKIFYKSFNPNCDFFQLAGWLKISETISDDNQFQFHIISITKNTQKNLFRNQNLSPLNLYYDTFQNKIVYTTYSYTFPSVNVDFSTNPYLIKKEFIIEQSLFQWHYISVTLIDTQFIISIEFPDGINNIKYEQITEVNQFKIVTFEIQFGNIQDSKLNYLNYYVNSLQFTNCDQIIFKQACHYSCSLCNGPTEYDCLECQFNSNRIYLSNIKKCVCPYNTLDKGICQTYEDYNLIINQENNQIIKCQYGYFEYEEGCLNCPEFINYQQINCIECLTNPKTWKNMLYCKTSLISNNDESYQDQIDYDIYYYIIDGLEVKFCQTCKEICQGDECFIKEYEQPIIIQSKVCQNSQFGSNTAVALESCPQCIIAECLVCGLSIEGFFCLICYNNNKPNNGQCVEKYFDIFCTKHCSYCIESICYSCYSPYYLNSEKNKCKLCPIKHCKFCFEYQSNDLQKVTLYKRFEKFQQDEFTQIGCSLCEDGFNFNFLSGECIQSVPSIVNCLRSYKYQGSEVCTLSAIDDFNVAPQIINCQIHLNNCLQCILTPDQIIKCVLCQDGYSVTTSGNCEVCTLQFYATSCVEGDYRFKDYWVQSIQSFMIQFLPNNYYYPKVEYVFFLQTFPLSCPDGYMLARAGICYQYCQSDCVECRENIYGSEKFQCRKCPQNYYGQQIKSLYQNNCLYCQNLCLACRARSTEEIAAINPYFVPTKQNIFFTHKCLKSVEDSHVVIDYQQIVSFCFDDKCSRSLSQQFEFSSKQEEYLTLIDYINFDYCNQMGIVFFKLILAFDSNFIFLDETMYAINLKQYIFSLQNSYLLFIGKDDVYLQSNLYIENYDILEMNNIVFVLKDKRKFQVNNDNKPVDLRINNCTFQGSIEDQAINYQISLALYTNLAIYNVTYIDLNLKGLPFLEYSSNLNEYVLNINKLKFINCTFQNVIFFSFMKFNQSITISEIDFFNSTFINTVFIQFNYSPSKENLLINQITLKQCTFKNSSLIRNIGITKMEILDFHIHQNYFITSVIIEAYFQSLMKDITIYNCKFEESAFFKNSQQSNIQDQSLYSFCHFNIQQITLSNSTLIFIENQKPASVEIQHFYLNNLRRLAGLEKPFYLYKINCFHLSVFNFTILDSNNIQFFRIYQTYTIKFNQTFYYNKQQDFKILPISACYLNEYNTSSLLYVLGFSDLSISNVEIINQFSFDISLINIISDLLFQVNEREVIHFQNITFFGNILLKRNLAIYFSAIIIYSENSQNIILENLQFEQNFFHYLIDDPTQTTAGLIYINSQLSDIRIENINFTQNGVTNSSSSILYISSKSIIFNQFKFIDINSMDSQIWQKYYQIDQNIESIKIQIIQKIYTILSKGGTGQIYSSNITISNGYFNNIIAQSSFLFYIVTQGNGIITFINHTIIKVSLIPYQNIIADGCITIYSINSLLSLQMNNIYFQNIYNRQASALVTIYPSLKNNNLNFIKIQIEDCYSLINTFMGIEFFEESASMNRLVFQQIIAHFSIDGWNEYLRHINQPQITEVAKIKTNNGFINLKTCSISANNIEISGLIISPILLLNDVKKIKLKNFRIHNVNVMYPLRLFYFIFSLSLSHDIFLDNIYFINIEQNLDENNFNEINNQNIQKKINSLKIKDCNSQWEIDIQTSDKENLTIVDFINFLNLDQEQSGSLMQIQGLSELSRFFASKLILLQNNCNFCYDGLINIQQKTKAYIMIRDIKCFSNQITQYGCLVLQSQVISDNKIIIKDSVFFNNNGSIGVGIYSLNIKVKIYNCYFIQNQAKDKAGAIFLEYFDNNFLIKNSIIQNNEAKIGGGLFLARENYKTDQNFINTILLFNEASFMSNNLVEVPFHLTLKINNQDMQSLSINNIEILKLNPYQIIDQDRLIKTDYLYLPSNYKLNNYQKFNSISLSNENYITQIALNLKNSLNEEIEGNEQDYCKFTQRQVDLEQIYSDFTNLESSIIQFNSDINSFDIGNSILNFDPNTPQTIISQLLFQFFPENGNKSIKYQINARIFHCQLGEFYTNKSCQMCEPTYGFYSVKYNVTRCSIFDPTRFKNITSNLIELKEGYWRPHFQSDYVEGCFKNTQACKGGWNVNYYSCQQGHIGGLCEECDIYNIRGDGYYSKTDNTQCLLCQNGFSQYIPFILLIIWQLNIISEVIYINFNHSQKYMEYKQNICQTQSYDQIV